MNGRITRPGTFNQPGLSRYVLGIFDFGKSTSSNPKLSMMWDQRVGRPNPYEDHAPVYPLDCVVAMKCQQNLDNL